MGFEFLGHSCFYQLSVRLFLLLFSLFLFLLLFFFFQFILFILSPVMNICLKFFSRLPQSDRFTRRRVWMNLRDSWMMKVFHRFFLSHR